MKKLIYLVIFVIVAGIATSCTEENIQPQGGNGGATEQRGI